MKKFIELKALFFVFFFGSTGDCCTGAGAGDCCTGGAEPAAGSDAGPAAVPAAERPAAAAHTAAASPPMRRSTTCVKDSPRCPAARLSAPRKMRYGTCRQRLTLVTSQLNLSAVYGIGGARKDCVAHVKGVLGGI